MPCRSTPSGQHSPNHDPPCLAQPRVGWIPEWGGFLAIDDARQQVVGIGGYVAAPDGDRAVEIAYGTSTRILQKHGFVQTGTAHDDDAGLVWRWERPL